MTIVPNVRILAAMGRWCYGLVFAAAFVAGCASAAVPDEHTQMVGDNADLAGVDLSGGMVVDNCMPNQACQTKNPGDCAAGITFCSGNVQSCVPNMTTQRCYDGPPSTMNKGVCKAGTQTCIGALGSCDGEVQPAAVENCFNDLDDDCDGVVNNGCPDHLTTGTPRLLTAIGTQQRHRVLAALPRRPVRVEDEDVGRQQRRRARRHRARHLLRHADVDARRLELLRHCRRLGDGAHRPAPTGRRADDDVHLRPRLFAGLADARNRRQRHRRRHRRLRPLLRQHGALTRRHQQAVFSMTKAAAALVDNGTNPDGYRNATAFEYDCIRAKCSSATTASSARTSPISSRLRAAASRLQVVANLRRSRW